MSVPFSSFNNFITKIRKLFGTGYFKVGDIEVIIYKHSFVVLAGPLFSKEKYDYLEYFNYLPHGKFFGTAVYYNNLRILQQLYKEGYAPNENVYFEPRHDNEEAIQFVIEHWPGYFRIFFNRVAEKGLSNNKSYNRYYLNIMPADIFDYVMSEWLDEEKISIEMLTWLEQNGVDMNYNSFVQDWLDNGWPGRSIPTPEVMVYILKKTDNYFLGNRLRYDFYYYAPKEEKEKWYDYIDDILNAKGIPADYNKLVRIYLEEWIDTNFLTFIRNKGYSLTEYIHHGSIVYNPEFEDLIQQGGIIDIRNIIGISFKTIAEHWSRDSIIEKLNEVIYPNIKDKPYLIRRLMKFTPPKVLKLLDANIINDTVFYFYLLR